MKLVVLILVFIANLNASELTKRVQSLINYNFKRPMRVVRYDPFCKGAKVVQKSITAKKEDNKLYISSVLNSKAFIGSNWYGVGDEVLGYKIIGITKESVLVRANGKVYKLGLKRNNKILKIRKK
jgi:hypothetical protein